MSNPTGEAQRLILADLDILAHPKSAPITYCTALQLPAAGGPTDPNNVATPPIPVPSWALNAAFHVAYAPGANSTGGAASIDAAMALALGDPLASYGAFGVGTVTAPGASTSMPVGALASIGFSASEEFDTAHPGTVTIKVVFTR